MLWVGYCIKGVQRLSGLACVPRGTFVCVLVYVLEVGLVYMHEESVVECQLMDHISWAGFWPGLAAEGRCRTAGGGMSNECQTGVACRMHVERFTVSFLPWYAHCLYH